MLLSQRIAKDPNFLRKSNKDDQFNLFEFRQSILRSTKFIVPGGDISRQDVFGVTTEKNKPLILTTKQRETIAKYLEFIRLPFDEIFIVSGKQGILVKKHPDPEWSFSFQPVGSDGRTGMLLTSVKIVQLPDNSYRYIFVNKMISAEHNRRRDFLMEQLSKTGSNDADRERFLASEDSIKDNTHKLTLGVFEILVFLNLQNVEVKTYEPTKKELQGVPKPFLPMYSYKIVDLYRTHTRYVSLEDAQAQVDRGPAEDHRRAHMVRGHFKRKSGKLYWWHPHMRSRKNLDTLGFVDKDYQLKDFNE